MHIPDWDDRFLSQYDPVVYAELIADSGVDSVMVYAQSHVGLTYWPSTTGKRHPALKGRNWFGETVAALRRRGVEATAYYSVIFNNVAAGDRGRCSAGTVHDDRTPAPRRTRGVARRRRTGDDCALGNREGRGHSVHRRRGSAGTLNRFIYELLVAVFERVGQYTDVIGGEPVSDVAVYLNDYSKVSESDNGAHCFPSEHFGPECDFPKRQDRLKRTA